MKQEQQPKLQKKILQIRKGEYLLGIVDGGVATTHSQESALDISDWLFDKFTFFISNLNKVGYKKTQVIYIDVKENNDEV